MLNKISNEIIKMSIKTGQRTFNFALKTTKNNVEKVEPLIKEHAEFMKKNHSFDESKIQLVHYYVSKSEEFIILLTQMKVQQAIYFLLLMKFMFIPMELNNT
jgi:hypothetical protein